MPRQGIGHLDIQDKQRDGDSKYGITEKKEALQTHIDGFLATYTFHWSSGPFMFMVLM